MIDDQLSETKDQRSGIKHSRSRIKDPRSRIDLGIEVSSLQIVATRFNQLLLNQIALTRYNLLVLRRYETDWQV